MAYRKPTEPEARLLVELARAATTTVPAGWLQSVLVEPMEDGGMGSLRLQLPNVAPSGVSRLIGSELLFKDRDGVHVLASLYLDSVGTPVELDLWKVDFSPLLGVPDELPAATVPR